MLQELYMKFREHSKHDAPSISMCLYNLSVVKPLFNTRVKVVTCMISGQLDSHSWLFLDDGHWALVPLISCSQTLLADEDLDAARMSCSLV